MVDKLNPMATENTRLNIDSVSPTVGHRVRAQTSDPENINHSEQGFQHHLEHHGHSQQKNGAINAAFGVVVMDAADGVADGAPP